MGSSLYAGSILYTSLKWNMCKTRASGAFTRSDGRVLKILSYTVFVLAWISKICFVVKFSRLILSRASYKLVNTPFRSSSSKTLLFFLSTTLPLGVTFVLPERLFPILLLSWFLFTSIRKSDIPWASESWTTAFFFLQQHPIRIHEKGFDPIRTHEKGFDGTQWILSSDEERLSDWMHVHLQLLKRAPILMFNRLPMK